MKLLAAAGVALALAVAGLAVVVLGRDHSAGATTVTVNGTAARLAGESGVSPEVMEERLRIASDTCDVMKAVGANVVATVCRFNIVNGDAWWDGMPPRQLRDVTDALIRAQR